MEINDLLKLQAELDHKIMEKVKTTNGEILPDKILLALKITSLSVEVSEFANATRCFKYWSLKQSESKERLLDEFVDILHFWLSIANLIGFTGEDIEAAYRMKRLENLERVNNGY